VIAKLDATLLLLEETADIRRKAKEIQYGNQIAYIDAETRRLDQQNERIVQQRKLVESAGLWTHWTPVRKAREGEVYWLKIGNFSR
jgi:hypothetical protein